MEVGSRPFAASPRGRSFRSGSGSRSTPGIVRALAAIRPASASENLAACSWVSLDHVALDGRKGTSSSLYLFGTPGAVAVVLRHEPENAQAKAILRQMRAAWGGATWMPPRSP